MRKLSAFLCLAFLCVMGADVHAQTPLKSKPTRPLVFLPGIAGSELWINGKRAWGSIEAMMHLEDLSIPNGPAMIEAAPTCDPANTDTRYRQSCGPINQLVVLGPMKYDQYEPLFKYLETLGYSRFGVDRNVFIFAYDWRRSNFDTAAQLDAFLRNTPGLANKEIDVLAHSMGGLVTLIYAHQFDAPKPADGKCNFPQSCRLKTVTTMGTPYWGSVSAVSTPIDGWGWLSRRLAGGQEAISRTVLSWPSLYELLPTHEKCCTASDATGQRPLDLLKLDDFRKLPFDLAGAGVPAAAISQALKRAGDLRNLAAKGFPPHVRNAAACKGIPPEGFFAIAGDHNGTKEAVAVAGGAMNFTDRRGDGTVLLRSASMGYPAGAFLSFSAHMSIFNDENVKAKLESILLRCEMSFKNFNAIVPTIAVVRTFAGPDVLPVDFISAELIDLSKDGPDTYRVHGVLSLSAPDDVITPKVSLRAKLNGSEFYKGDVPLKSKRLEGAFHQFDYEDGSLTAPGAGVLEVQMTFGSDGPTAIDKIYVLGK
jgi:pimeloyl-ACP methyl ester carboxylesterase